MDFNVMLYYIQHFGKYAQNPGHHVPGAYASIARQLPLYSMPLML